MVFQSYAIWPHMTVAQNVAYPLEIRKVERAEIDARVADVLELVGLDPVWRTSWRRSFPAASSSARRWRAQSFRGRGSCCSTSPCPTSTSSCASRCGSRLKRIQHEVGITSIYVTHDQAEALVMSDEIIVMSKGRIQQKGGPRDIYSRPVNAYVSNFIGVANLLKGRVIAVTAPGRGDVEVAAGGRTVQLPCRLGDGIAAGAETVVSVRPENVEASRNQWRRRLPRRRSDPGHLPRQLR